MSKKNTDLSKMSRRDFIWKGSLTVSLAATSGSLFSFIPDAVPHGSVRHHEGFFTAEQLKKRRASEIVNGYIWIDAKDFEDYGGWGLDTQFVAFMGSPYLIAHGTSSRVQDAVTSFRVRQKGAYRLWIRSRNWIPAHSPGRFRVSVDGIDSSVLFGAQDEPGWNWQDGGMFELGSGRHRIALKDQTGFYGRCSSILLTRDLDYVPPVALEAFRKERFRLLGEQDDNARMGNFDVVVVGAGPAGVPAAVAAARHGARTALICDRPVVGGNASNENGVPIQGAASNRPDEAMRESGIVEEVTRIRMANEWGRVNTQSFQQVIDGEPLLTLFVNSRLTGAEVKNGKISEVQIIDTLDGKRSTISGKMFIDTSGDGWLGHYAGADYHLGREAYDEYKEPLAPPHADNLTMSGCVRGPAEGGKHCIFFRSAKLNRPVAFESPSWVYHFSEEWKRRRGRFNIERVSTSGSWWLEHSGEVDDLWQPEDARDELIRINFSYWNYIKNEWEHKALLDNYLLDYVPYSNAKRETRRLLGDHILDQNDVHSAREFPDVIGHGGWHIDLHARYGIFDLGGVAYLGENNEFSTVYRKVPIYGIPFRSLFSRNISNLLMGGRCMSVTHVALGTVRIEGTCCVTGQAAGTGAAMAVRHGCNPRKIYQTHIEELQQTLLLDDVYIPGIKNRDAADLARQAQVTAGSHAGNGSLPASVINGWARPLKENSNMWASDPDEKLPQWIRLDFKTPVQCNLVQCTFDTNLSPRGGDTEPIIRESVSDYIIEGRVNGKWRTLARAEGNFQRMRRHHFRTMTTDAIRLTVTKTNGSPDARIFEVRLYNI